MYRKLLQKYQYFYRDLNYREIELLDKPAIGQNSTLHENARIQNGAIVGNNVRIGSGVYWP